MPFREKKAWATLFTLLIVFVPYYYFMVDLYHQPEPDFHELAHLATVALHAFIVLEVVLLLLARWLSPEDKGIPLDEREQLFAARATKIAYVTLIIASIAVVFPMIHVIGGNWGWGMSVLGAIILAEMVRAIALIVQYRRGW